MELLGRDPQLRAAARAIGDVRRGTRRVLALTGGAGLGKSALLAAIAERARAAGLLVLEGRGVEHERGVPLGVAIDAFGELARDAMPAAGDPAGAQQRAWRGVRTLVERDQPAALLLDDLQWADEASLQLFLHVLRRPPRAALLVVFAMRPGEPARRLLDAARSASGWEPLALEPLDRAASLGLLADVADPAERERVASESRGNPLFLRELGRVAQRGGRGLPATLVAAAERELAALGSEARRLAEGAAVIRGPFDLELAAAAAGLPASAVAAALDELVAADLLRPSAGGRAFAFRHPLVRRAVYEGTPPGWRLSAHERAWTALERRGAKPAARAFHGARCARVGDERAIAAICEAAADASPPAAANWYGVALRLLPDRARDERARLLERRALALAGAGALEQSRAALLTALALAPRTELVVACAQVEIELGRPEDARRRLLAAHDGAADGPPAALVFELAAAALHEGHASELRRLAGRAVAAAKRAGDRVLVAGAEALVALGRLWAGEPHAAQLALTRASTGLDALDDGALAARPAVGVYVGIAQLQCERVAAAAATAARTLAVAHASGQRRLAVTLHALRAIALLMRLELDAARRAADAAEDVARRQRFPHLLHRALWVRGLVLDALGETYAAERAGREGAALTPALQPSGLSRTAACELAALDAAHDPQRAWHGMRSAGGPALEHVDPTWRTALLLRLVRAAIADGAVADAERCARAAEEHGARLGLAAGRVRAACARAEVLLARGGTTTRARASCGGSARACPRPRGAPSSATRASARASARSPRSWRRGARTSKSPPRCTSAPRRSRTPSPASTPSSPCAHASS